MKKITCLLAAMLLIFAMMPIATAQETALLRLESGTGEAEGTVTVSVLAENAPNCMAYELIITYDDTILKPIEVKNVEADGLSNFNMNYLYQGKAAVKMATVDLSHSFSGNATLATVTFEILKETPGPYGTPLKISYGAFTKEQPGMQTGQIFGPERKSGRVYVGEDEKLSTAPAIEILRHLIGIPSQNEEYLDWNGDGTLTTTDAVLLLRELN